MDNEIMNIETGTEKISLMPEDEKTTDTVPEAEPPAADASEAESLHSHKKKVVRMSEIPALRDDNRKVFAMSDGTQQAVFYAKSVHVYNHETDSFEEADNTLVAAEDGRSYINRKNRFVAHFNKEEDNDELFSIEERDCRVTMSARKRRTLSNRMSAPRLIADRNDAENAKSLIYERAEADADFEYTVEENGVKENIVIKERKDVYRYAFTLQCENVTPHHNENEKRIVFIHNENNREVFYIPAPYMRDANGEESTAVTYDMHTAANGDTVLTVTADSAWINANGRAFPVTVDPQIYVSDGGYIHTYSWKDGTLYSSDTHKIAVENGVSGGCSTNRMYVQLDVPQMPWNPRIKKAELKFYQQASYLENGSSAAPKLCLYQVDDNYTLGQCTPLFKSEIVDYECVRNADTGMVAYTFDVTGMAENSTVIRLVVRIPDETSTSGGYAVLYGSDSANYAPEFAVTYESSYGVNTTHRAHSHDLGRFGRGSVDLARGNLMLETDDFVWAGNRMPVTIKHYYNSALGNYRYTQNAAIGLKTADFSAMNVGRGYKLNIMQSMCPCTFAWDGVQYSGYVYIGENGDETYFKQSDDMRCDDSGQCYHLYTDVNGAEMSYDPGLRTLTSGDTTMTFDAAGRLTAVEDKHGNRMTVTYSGGRITRVSDGVGREFQFAYSGNNLASITAPDDTSITYEYVSDCLTSITYQNNKKVDIAYFNAIQGRWKPVRILLKDNNASVYEVAYSYYYNGRIESVTEYGYASGAKQKGVCNVYQYNVAARNTHVSTTEPKDTAEGETDDRNIRTVYTFDDNGEVISRYAYAQDSGRFGVSGEESGINPYAGNDGSGVVSNINNLVQNHTFCGTMSEAWSTVSGTGSAVTASFLKSESAAKYGGSVIQLYSGNSSATDGGIYQSVSALPKGQYTFSAYTRVVGAFYGQNIDRPGVFIRVTREDGTVLAESEHNYKYSSRYIRLIAPFELTAEQNVRIAVLANGYGTAYIDAPQLENNAFVNAYNMLENGNFESAMRGWTTSGYMYNQVNGERFNMKSALCIPGSLSQNKYAYQTADVKKARSTRETFTLSGWAKGRGIAKRERPGAQTPTFRLRALITYNDAYYNDRTSETYVADFSPCTEEWQFASVQFSKAKYRTIESVRVYCDYGYNINSAYFDDIQLVRNSVETDLRAEDFEIREPDVDTTETPETVATSTAKEFSEVTDAFGNTLTETTYTDGEFGTLYRAFAYNVDNACTANNEAGNDLVSETDTRNNKTQYAVEYETSRRKEITDRCGNVTAYEYDDSGRTTKVKTITPKSGNNAGTEIANVSYAYDAFDNMTAITRGDGMKYVLNYNPFHNLASIGVNGKAENLVSYEYKNGNGRLKKVTYANGDYMKVTYNSIGQMTAEKWYNIAGTVKAEYRYVYDGKGNIVRSIDITGGKEYNYIYEEDRIVSATEYTAVWNGSGVTSKTLVNTILYVYDNDGKLTKKRVIPEEGSESVSYYDTPENGNTVKRFEIGGQNITSHSKNDKFGRKVFDELQIGKGFVSRQFAYHAGSVPDTHKNNDKIKSSATTQLVSQIVMSDGRTLSYEYDKEERIVRVTDSKGTDTRYTYDAQGQLLTETVNGKVENTMRYDGYGNIISKNGIQYCYGDTAWKDLLTCYNGQELIYDAQGNPTTYLGHTLTWEKGRQLKSYDGIGYSYNANGIRTEKNICGEKHVYTVDGTKLLREVWGTNEIVPLYSNEDDVCGILYNKQPYYFLKNLQGDVIAIVDKNAQTVAEYTYDAWGVPTIRSDSTACRIATVNPFRYRGYYYDEETGLYYLNTRYYDPAIGRFINVDDANVVNVDNKNATILQYSLFAYTFNNPVNEVDCDGTYSIRKILAILFKAVGKGIFTQFMTDMIVCAFNYVVLNKYDDNEVLSSPEDYLYAILCALLEEAKAPTNYMAVAKVTGTIAKYLWKLIRGRMTGKDWTAFVFDLLSIAAEFWLKNLTKKYSSQITKLKKRKKNSKNLERRLQNKRNTALQIKLYYCGIHLDITLPISGLLFTFMLNIIFNQ